MPDHLHATEIRRGDVIEGRNEAVWTERALVLRVVPKPGVLVLDLLWLAAGNVMTGCSLGDDDYFLVERRDVDVIIERMRCQFADFCDRRGL